MKQRAARPRIDPAAAPAALQASALPLGPCGVCGHLLFLDGPLGRRGPRLAHVGCAQLAARAPRPRR